MRAARRLPASVARRVGLTLAAVGLAVVAFGAATVGFGVQSLRSADVVSHYLIPVERDTNLLLTAYVNQETGLRGYVITGQKSFLQPFYDGERTSVHLTFVLRRKLVAVSDRSQLAATTRAHNRWLETTALPEIADVARGDTAAAVAAERTGVGKRRFDRLRSDVSHLSATVAHLETTSVTGLRRRASSTVWLAIIEGAAALLLLGATWLVLRRWVTAPIAALEGDVRAVADGDLDHRIEVVGLAEMESLAKSVESMRERLRADTDELLHLRAALVSSVSLQEQLSQELLAVGSSPEVALAGRTLPAGGMLAGDWYDAWSLAEGCLALALVDVSGHGALTGIFALQVKTLLKAIASGELAPGEALGQLAEHLGETDERFVTGILLYIDTASGECSYANAGHPAGLVLRHGEDHVLAATGPLLGPFPASWRTETFRLETEALLVLYTDGVVEARHEDGREFGVDGLVEAISDGAGTGEPTAAVAAVIERVEETCLTPLDDDATIVACKLQRASSSYPPMLAPPEPA